MSKKTKNKKEVHALMRKLHGLAIEIRYRYRKHPQESERIIFGELHSVEYEIVTYNDFDYFTIADIFLLQDEFDGARPSSMPPSYRYGWCFSIRYQDGRYSVSIWDHIYIIEIFINGVSLNDFLNQDLTLYDLI